MNKLSAVVLVIIIGFASSMEIASVDCDGRIQFMPSYDNLIQADLSDVAALAESYIALFKDRLKCMCPELTDYEFDTMLHPFFGMNMLFNVVQGPDADLRLSRCNWSAFEDVTFRADRFSQYKFNFTDTCTNETWARDGKCLFQSNTFSDWDVSLKVALFRCPKAPWRPSVSILCDGNGCEQSFFPCMSDADCAGDMTCQKLFVDNIERPSHDDLVSAFRTVLLSDDIPATCIASGDFLRTTINWFRKLWKADAPDYTLSRVQICSPVKLDFSSNYNAKFDWENIFHYTNTSLVTTNNSVAFPGYLQPWQGELNAGGKVMPPKSTLSMISNDATITPNATLLFKKTCSGVLTALPTMPVQIQFNFPFLGGVIDQWTSTLLSILKCRFNYLGVFISEQELINRWGLGLDYLFFNNDIETRDDPITREDIRDYRTKWNTRIEFPSSCSYDSWVNDGSCRATYTGFNNLLGTDVTVNLEILQCPGSRDMGITVECVGEACDLVSAKSQPCSSDADCPSSLACKDLNPMLGHFDILQYLSLYGSNKPDDQCVSNDTRNAALRKMIFSYWGLPYDGSSDNKYCMLDYDHIRSQISTWVDGEVETTSPGVVKLKNLKSWKDEGKRSWASKFTSNLSILLLVGGMTLSLLL